MICFAKDRHKNSIINLWNEAFGDSVDEISAILLKTLKHTVVFEENGIVVGMLTLLPVKYSDKNGFYVYAVATLKSYRGKGISTQLLDFAKKQKADFLVLVPQTEELFEFYKNRGFSNVNCIKKGKTLPRENKEISISPVSAYEYFDLRKKFCNKTIVEWDREMLGFAGDLYKGKFCALYDNNKKMGCAFYRQYGEVLYVKEILAKDISAAVEALGFNKNAENVVYAAEGEDKFAMIYPKNFSNLYFNIAFD